jgi:hypothetical protein
MEISMNIAICGSKGSGTEVVSKWFNTNTTFTYKHDIQWYAATEVLNEVAEKGTNYDA